MFAVVAAATTLFDMARQPVKSYKDMRRIRHEHKIERATARIMARMRHPSILSAPEEIRNELTEGCMSELRKLGAFEYDMSKL